MQPVGEAMQGGNDDNADGSSKRSKLDARMFSGERLVMRTGGSYEAIGRKLVCQMCSVDSF